MDGNSFTYGLLVGSGLVALVWYIQSSSIPPNTSIPKTTVRKIVKCLTCQDHGKIRTLGGHGDYDTITCPDCCDHARRRA